MNAVRILRPEPSEYAAYFSRYIDQLPQGDILTVLRTQGEETQSTLGALSETDAQFRYAPGKWSIKQIGGHLTDAERIFGYRALCFARGEKQRLPGFDENEYVAAASFDRRSLADHLTEFRAVRAATLSFFSGLSQEELLRRGTANQWEYTVRATPFIVAGHERHHLGVIRERYLGGKKR